MRDDKSCGVGVVVFGVLVVLTAVLMLLCNGYRSTSRPPFTRIGSHDGVKCTLVER